MSKKAFISKHIVLTTQTHSTTPVYGIILIDDEIIYDTIIIDSGVPVSVVLEKYQEWNPEDVSDLYISPGIIDLNTRIEWESYTELTKAGIAGGVTVALLESGYYNEVPPSGKMYCDIAKVATLEISTMESIPFLEQRGYLAVKGYLFPPCSTVQCIPANLQPIFEEIVNTRLTLIVDPNLPDPRSLHAVSPYRFRQLQDRLLKDTDYNSSSAAFSELIEPSDEENQEENEERLTQDSLPLYLQSKRQVSYDQISGVPYISKDVSPGLGQKKNSRNTTELALEIDKLKEIDQDFARQVKRNVKRHGSNTIYDSLNARVKESQMTIRNLSIAELETYKGAGTTEYLGTAVLKPSALKQPDPVPVQPASAPSLLQRRKLPVPLSLEVKQLQKKDNTYSMHMANYSHFWEISGIDKLIASLNKFPCRVHICNVSSAASLNKIRQAKETHPNLTCEIPASHLIFSSRSIPESDTRFKLSPPIRNQGNTNLLWDLLKMKGIDVVTSNHACIEPKYKLTNGSFQKAANGIPAIGYTLQSVWTTLNGPISSSSQLEHYIVRLAKWMSLHPAEVLSISSTRGSISKGKFADLILWKPFEKYVVRNEMSPFPEISPFLGMEFYGKIQSVYLRGRLAFNQGKFKDHGRFVQRIIN